MSKFCKTEELAQATVDNYQQKFEAGTSPYDTPTYRLIQMVNIMLFITKVLVKF